MEWTVLKILDWTKSYFEKHQIPSARLDAEVLLSQVLGLNRIQLYMQFEKALHPEELKNYKALIQRRIQDEPTAYIIGEKEFWSRSFEVGPGVLIPRPDTERLVEVIFNETGNDEKNKILDLGCGSGILAITLQCEWPSSIITGIDLSDEALEFAKRNAKKHHSSQINFLKKDILNDNFDEFENFDLIVSNPPYIATKTIETLDKNIRDYEPKQALDGGADGLRFYKTISNLALKILKQKGWLAVEIGDDQGQSVSQIFKNFQSVQVFQDYTGADRVILAQK